MKKENREILTPPSWRQVAFLKKFNENYNFLYDAGDRVAGYEEARDFFDEALKNSPAFKKLVGQIAKIRGDIFASDREAAAFAFTCADFELI